MRTIVIAAIVAVVLPNMADAGRKKTVGCTSYTYLTGTTVIRCKEK